MGAFSGLFCFLALFSWDICPFSKFHFGAIFEAVFGPFLMLLNYAPGRPHQSPKGMKMRGVRNHTAMLATKHQKLAALSSPPVPLAAG